MSRAKVRRSEGLGLVNRLLLNNLLVVVAGSGTVLITALLIAAPVFQTHLARTHSITDPLIQDHVAEAFDQALLTALGLGTLAAAVTATAISLLVARRLAAPVKDVADTTSQLADGHLDVRVADPRIGPEFAILTASVNQLAHRLQTTEATRRQLTSDLAHQLRTPIASLEATLEAVREGVLPVDESTLDTLTAQSARLRRLVADLEQVSRAEERQLLLRPQPTRVPDLVDAAIAAHCDRYRAADVHLTASIDADTPLVTVDPDRIQEVLANLLDNALKHTPPGGNVTVTCHPRPLPGGPAAVITVGDSGQGFTPDDADILFQRFHKGSDSTGSGLGLTIGRAIIEAHHGSLTAHSAGLGLGAVFTLVLPAIASAGKSEH